MKTLIACESWTSFEDIPLEEGGVEYLVAVGLLVEKGTARAQQDASIQSWEPWGVEAISYQFLSRRQFLDYPVAKSHDRAVAGLRGSPPLAVKSYPDSSRTPLPPPVTVTRNFGDVLLSRRTHRAFADEPLPLQECATLLGLVFGATRKFAPNVFGEAFLRTSPSAGGRHPVEAYVCALKVAGLAQGVYHYSVLDNELERLDVKVAPATLLHYMCDEWVRDAPLVCFLTAVVERCRWRYPFGRMYRTLLLDVGHIAQTFVLTSTALGLAGFQTAAFEDPLIEDALGLDPAVEPVLYAVGAGMASGRSFGA